MTATSTPPSGPVTPAPAVNIPRPWVIVGYQRARPAYSGAVAGRSERPDCARGGRERDEDGATLLAYQDRTRYCLRCGRLDVGPHALNGWRPPSEPEPIN